LNARACVSEFSLKTTTIPAIFFFSFFFFFFFFWAARNQYSMALLVLPPLLAEELGGGDSTIAAVHEYICGRAAKKWALSDAEGVAALWNALCLRAFPLALVGVNAPYVCLVARVAAVFVFLL
jgi:hypothetical protein